MKCVTRRDVVTREYFCPFRDGHTIRVKVRGRLDIGEQARARRNEKEWKNERERERSDKFARKRLRYCKTFVREKWIPRPPLRCAHRENFYWFSVRSDSQRSFRTHTSPSSLKPLRPRCSARSRFLLLFTDISGERVSRITTPLSGASYLPSSPSLNFSLTLHPCCLHALFPFSGDASSQLEAGSKTVPKLAQ